MCVIARAVLVAMVAVSMTTEVEGTWGRWWWRRRPSYTCNSNKPADGEKPEVSAPISQIRTINGVEDCTADIGTCPTRQKCRFDTTLDSRCPMDGYVCPETESRMVTCGIFSTSVTAVSRCVCCKDVGLTINGMVVDDASNDPISCVDVYINRKLKVKTDRNGRFTATISSGQTSITFKASDDMEEYIETVQVENLPSDARGPLEVTIRMISHAPPTEFESSAGATLTVGDGLDTRATIVIAPDAFENFDGVVLVSLTFIDSADLDTLSPGEFVTTDGGSLITNGIFSLRWTTISGGRLQAPLVTVTLTDGMRLWRLFDDGKWEEIENLNTGRKRRQTAMTEDFLVNLEAGRWINIDKLTNAPMCYFKARVFEVGADNTETEITESDLATFRPRTVVLTDVGQTLNIYHPFISNPASRCFTVRCRPVNRLVQGLISLTSHETIILGVGGASLPQTTILTPRPLSNYTSSNMAAHAALFYDVTEQTKVFTNFLSNVNGPFYTNERTCADSTIDQPAFHFFKNPLPVYNTTDEDVELCTARLGFIGNFNFNAVLAEIVANGDVLPNIQAVNTWNEGVNGSFIETSASLELSPDGEFYFACLRYRCSEVDSLTSVLVDIKTPNITMERGNTTYDIPAFYCYNGCNFEIEGQFNKQGCRAPFDGIFDAPANVTGRSDYFPGVDNDCQSKTKDEDFAIRFNCNGNKRFPNQEPTDFPNDGEDTDFPNFPNNSTPGFPAL